MAVCAVNRLAVPIPAGPASELFVKNLADRKTGTSISVVIPAFNEAAFIGDTLTSVFRVSSRYRGTVEVIVVDNNSTDGTGDIARAHGARVVFEGRNQIARARNAGAAAATGACLVFLDADTRISGDIFDKVHRQLASGQVIGGGAWVEMDTGWLGRLSFRFLVNYPLLLKNVTVGPFLYCERAAFDKAGGFDEELYAAEEFSLAKRLKETGKRENKKWKIIRYQRGHSIVTSSRKCDRYGFLKMAHKNAHLIWKPHEKIRQRSQCKFWYDVRK